MNKALPQFIRNNASGEDLLDNKPHESIADILDKIITQKDEYYSSLENHVIGIEGEWGSGKTNVIKVLEKRLPEEEYFVFTYDVWGHQEDLTRRSFLEELVDEILEKNNATRYLAGKIDWQEEKQNLSAKISRKNRKKFPKIKSYFILVTLSIIFWTLGSAINNIWGDDFSNWISSLIQFFIPVCFAVWAVSEICSDYKTTEGKDKWEKLSKILYWLNGSEIDSSEKENLIEDEPSVKRFQEFFGKVISDFKGKGLIIVFDNMDRVSSTEKLMETWSSIHTFFAKADGVSRTEEYNKVWTIIPYDKNNLSDLLSCQKGTCDVKILNEFLHKTFAISFRVAPPVMTSWKRFFDIKFNEAFAQAGIDKDEVIVITTLFKLSTDITKIKPREIISFINGLVALYLQHRNKGIEIKYLALYYLKKDIIEKDPIKIISSCSFLTDTQYLFVENDQIVQRIASIYYNIPIEETEQLLFNNLVTGILQDYDDEKINILKNSSAFNAYIESFLTEINYAGYPLENVEKLILGVEEKFAADLRKAIWNSFARNLLELGQEEPFKQVRSWTKSILTKADIRIANEFIFRIHNATKNDDKESTYYEARIELIKLKEQNERLEIPDVRKSIRPDNFLNFWKKYGDSKYFNEKFDEVNICTHSIDLSSELNKYLQDNDSDRLADYYDLIDFLYNQKSYPLKELRDSVDLLSKTVQHTSENKIANAVKLNQIFYEQVPVFDPNVTYSIFSNKIDTKPYFAEITAMMLMHHISGKRSGESEFSHVTFDENKIEKVAAVFEEYGDMGALLKYVVSNNFTNPMWNQLINTLVETPRKKRAYDEKWVFQSISKIQAKIFKEDEIFNFIADFDFHQADESMLSFDKVDQWWVKTITTELWDKHLSFKNVVLSYKNWVASLDEEEWIVRLKNNTSTAILTSNLLVDRGLVIPDSEITAELEQAIEVVLEAIANKEYVIVESRVLFIKNHLPYLKVKSASRLANKCLSILLTRGVIEKAQLVCLGEIIVEYSTDFYAREFSSDVKRKIIIEFYLKAKDLFNILIEKYTDKFIALLKNEDEENKEIFGYLAEMQDKLVETNTEVADKVQLIMKSIGLVDEKVESE